MNLRDFWVQTVSGRTVELWNPKPEDIDLWYDVPYSLARIQRFNGHCDCDYYSVSDHSVLVAEVCRRLISLRGISEIPRELLAYALLHDAHEAYVGDIVGPLKALMKAVVVSNGETYPLGNIVDNLDVAIRVAAGLNPRPINDWLSLIKEADSIALEIERKKFFSSAYRDWKFPWYNRSTVAFSDIEKEAFIDIGRTPQQKLEDFRFALSLCINNYGAHTGTDNDHKACTRGPLADRGE